MNFALLIYADEGSYYYTPLNAGSLKEAVEKSLEHMFERGDDFEETSWEIAEVAGVYEYHGKDFLDFVDKKTKAIRAENERRAENYERDQYERLKAKFEGKQP